MSCRLCACSSQQIFHLYHVIWCPKYLFSPANNCLSPVFHSADICPPSTLFTWRPITSSLFSRLNRLANEMKYHIAINPWINSIYEMLAFVSTTAMLLNISRCSQNSNFAVIGIAISSSFYLLKALIQSQVSSPWASSILITIDPAPKPEIDKKTTGLFYYNMTSKSWSHPRYGPKKTPLRETFPPAICTTQEAPPGSEFLSFFRFIERTSGRLSESFGIMDQIDQNWGRIWAFLHLNGQKTTIPHLHPHFAICMS